MTEPQTTTRYVPIVTGVDPSTGIYECVAHRVIDCETCRSRPEPPHGTIVWREVRLARDELQTTGTEITQGMIEAGRGAFKIVAERHGFDGLLNVGFIHNAIASSYLAMERERAGLPRRDDW